MKRGDANTVSIRSIDVGFDVRRVGQTVMLPAGTKAVLCDQRPCTCPVHRMDGVRPREAPVTGSPEQILRSLRGLGYSVQFAKGGKR